MTNILQVRTKWANLHLAAANVQLILRRNAAKRKVFFKRKTFNDTFFPT